MKRVVTEAMIDQAHAAGRRSIDAPRGETIVTPSAITRARELGVMVTDGGSAPKSMTSMTSMKSNVVPAKPRLPDPGASERHVDKSGVTVVRGKSVRLGELAAGPDKHIGLTDLITAKDGAPMTAGIMSWSRDDSFPWHLTYDEIDLVLEGHLAIEIDGRVVEGRAGDVVFIPKGSKIVFGTPSRVKVFYVTYPADWSAASGRPQK